MSRLSQNQQAQDLASAIRQVMIADLGLERRAVLGTEKDRFGRKEDFDHLISDAQKAQIIKRGFSGTSHFASPASTTFAANNEPEAGELDDLNAGQTWRINRAIRLGQVVPGSSRSPTGLSAPTTRAQTGLRQGNTPQLHGHSTPTVPRGHLNMHAVRGLMRFHGPSTTRQQRNVVLMPRSSVHNSLAPLPTNLPTPPPRRLSTATQSTSSSTSASSHKRRRKATATPGPRIVPMINGLARATILGCRNYPGATKETSSHKDHNELLRTVEIRGAGATNQVLILLDDAGIDHQDDPDQDHLSLESSSLKSAGQSVTGLLAIAVAKARKMLEDDEVDHGTKQELKDHIAKIVAMGVGEVEPSVVKKSEVTEAMPASPVVQKAEAENRAKVTSPVVKRPVGLSASRWAT